MQNDQMGMGKGTFTTGAVLSRAFSVFAEGFVPFCFITFVVYLPYLLLMGYSALNAKSTGSESFQNSAMIAGLLAIFLGPLATASLTFGVFQKLRGRDTPISECFSVGLSRMFAVLGVGIVTGLAVVAGLICLIVPGIYFLCSLWVATAVAVVERSGVSDSMSRSKELTAGYRWSVFGVIVVLILLGGVIEYGLIAVFGAQSTTKILVSLPIGVVTNTLGAVCAVVGYQMLRNVKEDVDIEEIASVFD